MKYIGVVNLTKGQGFTQVRPLLMEVKTYFLLLLHCFILDLDYRVPTPEFRSQRLLSGVANSHPSIARVSQTCKLRDLRSRTPLIKVAGSLDLQLTPSPTWTRSPTLGLGLPS